MAAPQFTLPPDTRAEGQPDPAGDMNAVTDALTAMGAGWNVLSTTFGGGLDPTGTADITSAWNTALAAVTVPGQVITVPPGTYKFSGTLAGYGGTAAAPVPVRITGAGPWEGGAHLQATSGLGANPAISMATKYAPAGTATWCSFGSLENLYIDLTASASSTGIYYDRVQRVIERNVEVRGGANGRVIGWCADLTFDDARCYNASGSYWLWLHAYSTDAPWDTANGGNTIGPGGTYSDSVTFKLNRPLNHITGGAPAGTANAFFTIKAGNDFQIIGGHGLRTPGGSAYITDAVRADFTGFSGGTKALYLFFDFHEIDSVYDHAGAGAGVTLAGCTTAVFGPNSWVSAAPAADGAGMYALKLTSCADVYAAGRWNGTGVLLDGANSQLNFDQARMTQSYGGGVFRSAASGTLNSAMNTLTLPQATITVDAMGGTLPAAGILAVATATGPALVSYAAQSTTAGVTTFTGCTGGTGVLATGGTVVLSSVTSSRFTPVWYSGTLADNAETAAVLAAAAPAQQQGPALFMGNATTAALQVGRAADTKTWQIMMDSSATGTYLLKNPEGATKFSLGDSGALTISGVTTANGFAATTTAKTGNYTLGTTDSTVLLNGATLTATLPTAVGISGRVYTVKLIANSTATVATTSSQTIDGATTYPLSAQYKFVTVQSDGAGWQIISAN